MGRPAQDLSNRRFGRLYVLSRSACKRRGTYLWICRCLCGVVKTITASALLSGSTKSCGCLRREVNVAKMKKLHVVGNKPRLKHGKSRTPEYRIWIEIRRRCENAGRRDYANYGGRGISVCRRWSNPKDGFENFLADMGERPSPKHTVGRKNNDGDYTPRNCRWETVSQQNDNKSSTIRLTWLGQTLTLREWAARTGQTRGCLYQRYLAGWPVAKILATQDEKFK